MRISFFCDTFLSLLAQKERKVSEKTMIIFIYVHFFSFFAIKKKRNGTKEKKKNARLKELLRSLSRNFISQGVVNFYSNP